MKLSVGKISSLRVYLMEAGLIGLFMVSACVCTVVLEHPESIVRQAIASGELRRAIMGIAMGLTALALLKSYWSRRTGGHMNPAVTLAAWRMKRIGGRDAWGYSIFQIMGAIAGVALVHVAVGSAWLAHPYVHFAATTPGQGGIAAAFAAEMAMSFVLMFVLIIANKLPRMMPHAAWIAGGLVAAYIYLEAPISGMSMNAARTIGSAVFAGDYRGLWIYLVAPAAGMLGAVEIHFLLSRSLCCRPVHDARVACHCVCDCLEKRTPIQAERTNAHVHGI